MATPSLRATGSGCPKLGSHRGDGDYGGGGEDEVSELSALHPASFFTQCASLLISPSGDDELGRFGLLALRRNLRLLLHLQAVQPPPRAPVGAGAASDPMHLQALALPQISCRLNLPPQPPTNADASAVTAFGSAHPPASPLQRLHPPTP